MEIEYVTGDLLQCEEKIIMHGCNKKYAYGSGVAGQIRKVYPTAYQSYMDLPELELGLVNIVDVSDDLKIANCITQEYYGYDGEMYVSYEAIRIACKSMNKYCKYNEIYRIAMPLIGAGLAGGSWGTISEIIEEEFTDVQPVIYLLDGVIPNS